jgi:predicted dehydrogenase
MNGLLRTGRILVEVRNFEGIKMEKLPVDVINTGKRGLLGAEIFNSLENSTLTAISEKDKMTVGVGQNYLAKVKFYEDYEKMLNHEKNDSVTITTPAFLHYSMIEAATTKKG